MSVKTKKTTVHSFQIKVLVSVWYLVISQKDTRKYKKLTGLRRFEKFSDKNMFGELFRYFGGYFSRFPVKI